MAEMLDSMCDLCCESSSLQSASNSATSESLVTQSYSDQLFAGQSAMMPMSDDASVVDYILSSSCGAPHFGYSQSSKNLGTSGPLVSPAGTHQPIIDEIMDTLEPMETRMQSTYQRQMHRKMADDSATNGRSSILTMMLMAENPASTRSDPLVQVLNEARSMRKQSNSAAVSDMSSHTPSLVAPVKAADKRTLSRRKIGAAMRSDPSHQPIQPSPVFFGSDVSPLLCPTENETGNFVATDTAEESDLWIDFPFENPASSSKVPRSGSKVDSHTMATGFGAKNTRRPLGGAVDDRRTCASLRRASTGSLPLATGAEFCVPQTVPIHVRHRYSVGSTSNPQLVKRIDGRHALTAEPTVFSGISMRSNESQSTTDRNACERLLQCEEDELNGETSTAISQSLSHALRHQREHQTVSDGHANQRKALHISSEQKRRSSIKNEFERMEELVTVMTGKPCGKCSKAALLRQAAVLCNQLKLENQRNEKSIEALKVETAGLETAIREYCLLLPSTGLPVVLLPPQDAAAGCMDQLFDCFVKTRASSRWLFGIFGFLVRSLFESYVDKTAMADSISFVSAIDSWLNEHCSLVRLRHEVSAKLVALSKLTSILDDASRFREEIDSIVMATESDAVTNENCST